MNIEDQIKCVAREIALRAALYPQWVEKGKMSEVDARLQIEGMEAVMETLKTFQKNYATQKR